MQTKLISSRLREVFLNGTWIANTNYRDQLKNIRRTDALHKIGDLNTIAALTYHINYYLAGLIHAFDSGKLEISDKYSFDVPETPSDEDWDNMVDDLLQNAEVFALKVELMDEQLLQEPFIEEKYGTYLRNVEGVIEHSYYHLGQIILIRKMIDGIL